MGDTAREPSVSVDTVPALTKHINKGPTDDDGGECQQERGQHTRLRQQRGHSRRDHFSPLERQQPRWLGSDHECDKEDTPEGRYRDEQLE